MRRSIRAWTAALGIAFEADRRLAVRTAIFGLFAPLSLFGIALSLKLIIDSALNHSPSAGIVGGSVAAIALCAGVAHLPVGASAGLVLQERIGAAVDRRLMSVVGAVPTLEIQDRPEYLSKLQLLLNERYALNVAVTVTIASLTLSALVVAVGVVLGLQNPLLALVPFLAIPMIWLGMFGERAFRRAEDSTAEERRLGQALFNLALHPAAGKELRIFGLGDELIARQSRAQQVVAEALDRASWISSTLRTITWIVFTFAYAVAVLVVVQRAADGRATAGDVILTIAVAAPIAFVAGNASLYISLFQQMLRAADRYLWLHDIAANAALPATDSVSAPSVLASGISLEHVGFRYPGSDETVLSDVNLDFPAGSVVAIVGENGAGKTTLVKLLGKLYEPNEGRVLVDGIDLSRIPADEWRRRISAGFQDYCQFEVVAREAVGVGDLPRIDHRRAVETAIDRAGANDVLVALGNDLERQLGKEWENGVELSTGQWQKLALARALMRDEPLMVVLDEPTAALDAAAEHSLFERFSQAAWAGRQARDRITLLVSHRFSTVRMADLIVVLDKGRVVDSGSHPELIARGGLYAELYELQARSYR